MPFVPSSTAMPLHEVIGDPEGPFLEAALQLGHFGLEQLAVDVVVPLAQHLPVDLDVGEAVARRPAQRDGLVGRSARCGGRAPGQQRVGLQADCFQPPLHGLGVGHHRQQAVVAAQLAALDALAETERLRRGQVDLRVARHIGQLDVP